MKSHRIRCFDCGAKAIYYNRCRNAYVCDDCKEAQIKGLTTFEDRDYELLNPDGTLASCEFCCQDPIEFIELKLMMGGNVQYEESKIEDGVHYQIELGGLEFEAAIDFDFCPKCGRLL